jgi:hypothetical protein
MKDKLITDAFVDLLRITPVGERIYIHDGPHDEHVWCVLEVAEKYQEADDVDG